MPVLVETTFQIGDLKFTNREVMRNVGLLVRETIRRRTARGESATGQPFEPYSAAYSKRKAEELGGAGTVNLTVSGQMLNALQILEVTDHTVTLGFV